jgi:hypothetical protein
MKQRKFGELEINVSALGFGAMRLPTVAEEEEAIDRDRAIEMMEYAFDHGVNYVDTAYPYHDGESELVVGEALANGYRDQVYLATKMPVWEVEAYEDFDRLLNEQLEKLRTDRIDFYLLHALREQRWPNVRDLGVLEWAEKAKADGRIGYLGFSFHDTYDRFLEIMDAYDWPFCQLQYNYMCEDIQAGSRGVEYAASQGTAVVVMEPLMGGNLAHPPDRIREMMGDHDPVSLALRWLWDKPEVALVLSGMSTLEQVKQNVDIASQAGMVGTLSASETELVRRLQDAYAEINPVPCTACRYCMPCPNGVEIPRNFELYNMFKMYDNSPFLYRNLYNDLPEEKQAANCIACQICEEKCPQGIEISAWMPKIDETLQKEEEA